MFGRSLYFDCNKAVRELGWTSRYGNLEMFRESYNWYLQHRHQLSTNGRTASHHRSPVKQGLLSVVSRLL
jgi:hypothetical protein